MPAELKTDERLVRGCTSRVWMESVIKEQDGVDILHFQADSDAQIVKGLIHILALAYQDIGDIKGLAGFAGTSLLCGIAPTMPPLTEDRTATGLLAGYDTGGFHDEAVTEDGEAVLRFVDEGHGIPTELLPRVFDLFTQGATGEAPRAGLGLGLTLVKEYVELHGGRVQVRSDGPGRGSEFIVRLPLPQPPK